MRASATASSDRQIGNFPTKGFANIQSPCHIRVVQHSELKVRNGTLKGKGDVRLNDYSFTFNGWVRPFGLLTGVGDQYRECCLLFAWNTDRSGKVNVGIRSRETVENGGSPDRRHISMSHKDCVCH